MGSSFGFSGILTGGRLGSTSEWPFSPGGEPWSWSMTGSTPRYTAGRWRMYAAGSQPNFARRTQLPEPSSWLSTRSSGASALSS